MRLLTVLVVSLMMLGACAAPAKTRYYMLSGVSSTPATEMSEVSDYRVAIGPVTVPDALDRQQIVLRVASNRYAILDDERWSEPLKREIPRVIAKEVGKRLPAARVAVHLQYGGQDADYRVLIDVLSFESVPGESITLEAAWSVQNRAGERLHETHSIFVERVNTPGVAPLVSAHAKALDQLGREIAVALGSLTRERP